MLPVVGGRLDHRHAVTFEAQRVRAVLDRRQPGVARGLLLLAVDLRLGVGVGHEDDEVGVAAFFDPGRVVDALADVLGADPAD